MVDNSSQAGDTIFVGKGLRVFISYSEKDKLVAAGIGRMLNQYGLQTFVAHDDIPPGEKWENAIRLDLRQCDVFLALVSKNYMSSPYTDQETGMAVALDKLIIPLSLDGTLPYGFMNQYQAFKNFHYEVKKYRSGEKYVVCNKDAASLVNFIAAKPDYRENVKECLITGLSNSLSFDVARNIMIILLTLKPFSKTQVRGIVEASIGNHNVYHCYYCRPKLRALIEEHTEIISQEAKAQLLELLGG